MYIYMYIDTGMHVYAVCFIFAVCMCGYGHACTYVLAYVGMGMHARMCHMWRVEDNLYLLQPVPSTRCHPDSVFETAALWPGVLSRLG